MDKYKNALKSRTVWSSIVGFAFVAMDLIGVNLGFGETAAVDAIMKMVEGACFLMAGWFRYAATQKLSIIPE